MRITGGIWRSRRLEAPKGDATRPTSDRVREALFSMLASDGLLDGEPRVLDLYAGSGALAFEALSRGAREAVLVEHARDALAAIRTNARALGAEERVRVVGTRVERAKLEGSFDIVLLDPPYAEVRAKGFGDLLAAIAGLVAPAGALVLEHAAQDAPPPIASLQLDRTRRHGDTSVTIYRRAG
jgi:16S rRNA (guanine966-N2)-methyltransferase